MPFITEDSEGNITVGDSLEEAAKALREYFAAANEARYATARADELWAYYTSLEKQSRELGVTDEQIREL